MKWTDGDIPPSHVPLKLKHHLKYSEKATVLCFV